ncbi:hypothetical protein MK786_14905 [Microbacterium sp. CFH 31415]|uniref:hypothetical protein n=1 Tax=Microbacterium sp. CFH 31415 TaxID=2921732 RepID=UPI001F1350F9|nr:hypothetical protein [Microbacterium sp. CFH 31415]MCH6232038.1 hypothetical protein [Microbacterium sp. CFH 31415]
MTPADPANPPVPAADRAHPGDDGAVDEATVIGARRRAAAEPVDEATAISARRGRAPDPVGEETVVSVRRRGQSEPDGPGTADDTIPSARGRGLAGPAVADDDTVLSRRSAAATDTVPDVEETLLRPPAASGDARREPGPVDRAPGGRDARIPDADALRAPVPPRPVPPVTAARGAAPVRPPSIERTGPVPDHESVERAARARDRRRTIVVVLVAAAVVLGSAAALVLLLT